MQSIISFYVEIIHLISAYSFRYINIQMLKLKMMSSEESGKFVIHKEAVNFL